METIEKILEVLKERGVYRSKGRYMTLPGIVRYTGLPVDEIGEAIDANHDKVYMYEIPEQPNELFVSLVEDQQ